MQAVSRFKYQPETAEQLALQLLAAGANLNARDRSGGTPLNKAADHVSAALAGALLEGGADPNPPAGRGKSPLETAAWSGNPEVIRLLTAAGAEVNRRNRDDGSTPLHTAVFSAYSASRVGALLEAGADPRLRNAAGDRPLHIAARRQDTVVASLLMNAGAELNARNGTGETPLEVARLHNAPVARKLVELGADPGSEEIAWIDKPPCGTIDWVVLGNSPPESVRDCLDAGAHVEEPIWFDRTPLLYLAETGLRRERATPEKIALLLAAGAGVNSRDRNANTPLHLVTRGGVRARDAAAVLLEGGADVNARNSDGRTLTSKLVSDGIT